MPLQHHWTRPALLRSSRERESPPSRTTLVVRHLRHDQLCHRHNGQHGSCWCWSRFSILPPPIEPFTRDLVIDRSWMFPFEVVPSGGIWHEYPQDILPYGRRFPIRQSSERKHSETAVGNMQRFRRQALQSRLEWMLHGVNNSSHMTSFQFMRI